VDRNVTDGEMSTTPPSDLRCERVRLLLSLCLDDEATPQQRAEIEAHLPACADCRAAQAADIAVRERVSAHAGIPSGFADRVGAGIARQRREARGQNRFLMGAAAAAVLLASVTAVSLGTPESRGSLGRGSLGHRSQSDGVPVADGSPREIAGTVLSATLAFGRAPRMGAEDR
jgi:anti-sigma factor RsiW